MVRSVPHRARDILRGLVNVRGELHPCVSLHALFDEQTSAASPAYGSLSGGALVGRGLGLSSRRVEGMHDVAEQEIEPLPVTITNLHVVYTQGLFHHGERPLPLSTEDLLFRLPPAEDLLSNLSAFSMWDLFRGEVESQMRVLTEGLLALESGGSAKEHLAATMRAAHSIKGAARIVRLDVAVTLAHAMEDCLVAAQEGLSA